MPGQWGVGNWTVGNVHSYAEELDTCWSVERQPAESLCAAICLITQTRLWQG